MSRYKKSCLLKSEEERNSHSDAILSQRDFQQIVKTLFNDSGIHLPESKTAFVQARLSKRLRALGLRSFREYCALIEQKDNLDERRKMLVALTTNITRFFREPHHFEHMRVKVLPELLQTARRGGRVRIWSAGCSSGQEAYSIALKILSILPEAASLDIRILASDIDTEVLAVGAEGVYEERETENIPTLMRQRWFTRLNDDQGNEKGSWRVSDDLKRMVVFRELNLNGPWPMRNVFHIIFCRNVVIYFDESTQERLWKRFVSLLSPGAALYLGHSETLSGPAASSFHCEGTTTYRFRDPSCNAVRSSPIHEQKSEIHKIYDQP